MAEFKRISGQEFIKQCNQQGLDVVYPPKAFFDPEHLSQVTELEILFAPELIDEPSLNPLRPTLMIDWTNGLKTSRHSDTFLCPARPRSGRMRFVPSHLFLGNFPGPSTMDEERRLNYHLTSDFREGILAEALEIMQAIQEGRYAIRIRSSRGQPVHMIEHFAIIDNEGNSRWVIF